MKAALAARLLVTLAAPVAVWAVGWVPLPGVDGALLEIMRRESGLGAGPVAQLSVVALGITPLLSAFYVVELVVLAVPRWRAARRGGELDDQRGLRRAGLCMTLLLALIQGFFIARMLEGMSGSYRQLGVDAVVEPGLGFELSTAVTLATGVFLVVWVAWLASRHGLLDGISTLLAAAVVPAASDLARAARREDATSFDQLLLVAAIVTVAAATRWILRAHRHGGHRLPSSGILPLIQSSSIATLLSLLGIAAAGSLARDALSIVLLLGSGVLFTALFHWRVRSDAALRLGTLRTAAWLLVLLAPQLLPRHLHVPFVVDAAIVAVATAVALDLVDEWRFRSREPGPLVALGEHHSLLDVDAALAKLAAAGVPALPRAVHHRALLRFFGPYIPVTILVPAARADEARRALYVTPRAPA